MIAGSNKTVLLLAIIAAIAHCPLAASAESTDTSIQFNRDIRPILSDNCFHCHGPDKAQRQADLRLDTEEGAIAELGSGGHAIVRGNASESEMARRITSDDDGERMPPADSGRALTPAQKEMLVRWIAEGAKWQKHWSLVRPERPAIPAVKNRAWSRVPWDAFVLARLEHEGLQPSQEADRETLLRRVTLDLTGLPPSLEEVNAFLDDNSPNAYEKVVDRLLASRRYGEQMATDWLDAARYADTNGYQVDGIRYMWRWRDWVIDALNNNMPFDQFTVEQLAGDMLPNATLNQKIASGFNRNHRGNAEGGIIPQEYAVEYVVDRVETTSTVWLGLTIGCARCHDHKFDPVTQKEFYQLFALFNNVPERGRAIKHGNSDPVIKAPTLAQQTAMRELDTRLAEARKQFTAMSPQIAATQAKWEDSVRSEPVDDWYPTDGLIVHLPFDGDTADHSDAGRKTKPKSRNIRYSPGERAAAAEFHGKDLVDLGDVANFGFFDRFSFAFWMQPQTDDGVILGRMVISDEAGGYSVELEHGKLQLNLVVRWLDDALRVETEEPLTANRWQHVAVSYDGSRVAPGIKIYVDGQPVKTHVIIDELNQDFMRKNESLVVGSAGPHANFQGKLDDVRVYDRVVSGDEAEFLSTAAPIDALVALPAAERTPSQSRKLTACFLDRYAPAPIVAMRSTIAQLEQQKDKLEQSIPTTMVMQEMSEAKPSFVLARGQYDQPGERVWPAVPASLAWSGQAPIRNRLDFARWVVAPENPLTARVAVNRNWQLYFGEGLVKTANDFGSQGERPGHPELLDFLATEFVSGGWNVKALHKSIVMSATYRQSSRLTPELVQRDPENRLLARGPRLRLSAETIRDQALFASGLLTEKIGGPSVYPYQPAGLWRELGNIDFTQDHGESLYRRGLYTFWKRTVAPPSMITFDASGRESCRVLQTRTNTPLQALTLLNEISYVEAARKLAERVLHEGGSTTADQLTTLYRLVLGRSPTAAELKIVSAGLKKHREHFRHNRESATKLLAVGESPCDEKLDAADAAAMTTIANLILNLDETITKQ